MKKVDRVDRFFRAVMYLASIGAFWYASGERAMVAATLLFLTLRMFDGE